MTNLSRRGFLSGIIAACAAPAIVRAGIVMPIKPALVTNPREVTVGYDAATMAGDFVEFVFSGVDAYGNPITETIRAPMLKGGRVGTIQAKQEMREITSVSMQNVSAVPAHIGAQNFGDVVHHILKREVNDGSRAYYPGRFRRIGDEEAPRIAFSNAGSREDWNPS